MKTNVKERDHVKRYLEKADVNRKDWAKMAEDREMWRRVVERAEQNS